MAYMKDGCYYTWLYDSKMLQSLQVQTKFICILIIMHAVHCKIKMGFLFYYFLNDKVQVIP